MKFSDTEIRYVAVSTVSKIVLCLLGLAMIWLDVGVFHTAILETSFTEVAQELLLFACALIFLRCSRVAGHKGFSVLGAGFFGCLLMRELDGLFDPISHSAWCWPFMLVLLLSLKVGLAPGNRADTVNALTRFIKTPAFGAMVSGGLVLVFSRVFGMGHLWHLILRDGYARLAKTMVEEGLELLAYTIWFSACVDHFFGLRAVARSRRHLRHTAQYSGVALAQVYRPSAVASWPCEASPQSQRLQRSGRPN